MGGGEGERRRQGRREEEVARRRRIFHKWRMLGINWVLFKSMSDMHR